MSVRIARHRAERPPEWATIEEPVFLAGAVECAARQAGAVLVDCLTVWLGNLFWEHRDAPVDRVEKAVRAELERIAAAAIGRHVILVSNEVGCATVPEHEVARAFRDVQGLLNQWAAEAADQVIFTVAGLPMYLKTAARAGEAS
jgi:adenosylcobinamide kinase / adenosylcobinamide-phosphate guanylyltransferase